MPSVTFDVLVVDDDMDTLGRQTTLRRVLHSLQSLLCDQFGPPPSGSATTSAAAPRYLSAGAIRLDTFQRRAAVHGAELELTVTEWTILHVLAQAGDTVVTFEQVVEQSHHLCMSRDSARLLLASHIRNLRRKLGPYSNYVRNIRGIGFCLTAGDR